MDRGHDGALLLQLGESFIDLLSTYAHNLCHFTCGDGLSCLSHTM